MTDETPPIEETYSAGSPRAGEQTSKCRSCSATIIWRIAKRGKRMPYNEDGTSHFATCPDAEQWRR